MRYVEVGRLGSQWSYLSCRRTRGRSSAIEGHPEDTALEAKTLTTDEAFDLCDVTYNGAVKSHIRVDLAWLRGLIGQTPIITEAQWAMRGRFATTSTYTLRLYRLLNEPDMSTATYRYRATGVEWTMDGYSPLPGVDVESSPLDELAYTTGGVTPTTHNMIWSVRPALQQALASGEDLYMMVWSSKGGLEVYWDSLGSRPYLRLWYVMPVEFHPVSPGTGEIIPEIVDNTLGSPQALIDLGAWQRGATGSPVAVGLRNYSAISIPHAVVWDDHPTWEPPVQVAGSGTGKLDYVALIDSAVSQRYTAVFSSATDYEVLAEGLRDNIVPLHPQLQGSGGWVGSTTGDWPAPSGGLTIPAAAWQPGTQVGDEIEILVSGQTSLSTWPADAGDQVEITDDDDGLPNAAGWRPLRSTWSRTTAAVTIDAATVKVPTRRLDVARWEVGGLAHVADDDSMHTCTVQAVHDRSVGTTAYAGSGADDLAITGHYDGPVDDDLVIEITATGTPDTYRVSWDGGSTWTLTDQPCSTTPTAIGRGLYAAYTSTTGHATDDTWTTPVQSWGVVLTGLTVDSTSYAAGALVSTGLPIRSLAAAITAQLTAESGYGLSPASRLYVQAPTSAGFAAGQAVDVMATDGTYESATITGMGSTYIDLDHVLTHLYPERSLVVVRGSGEAIFWLRAQVEEATETERKPFRVNLLA